MKYAEKYDIIVNMKIDCRRTEQKIASAEYNEKFKCFAALLREYNKRYNLTAILEEKEMFYKHFLDSAAGEDYFPQGSSVAEVGSGAGFPSVPLMIIREDLNFTLIESTGKKCEFLNIVCQKLGLKGIVLNVRAEEAGKDASLREKFDVCTARAVARLNTLSEYCMPLIKKGGKFIAYKGNAEVEIEEARRAVSLLGGGKIQTAAYELPEEYGKRTLVIVEKTGSTPGKYPRGRGKERSNPIV